MKVIKISCLLITLSHLVLAESLPDLNKYFKDMENNELKGAIGYETTDVKGKGMAIDQAESLGIKNRETTETKGKSTECNKGNCDVSHTFSAESTITRQEKAEAIGFIRDKDGNIKSNKGYLDQVLNTVKNSKETFDYLNGGYADCSPTEETIITKSETTCDQYYKMQVNSCMPKQVVEIDPKYNYVCNKKREVKDKVCTDVIKTIKCKNNEECDLGGIEPGSVASDMKFVFERGLLTIGTISDNYWGGHCAVYDRDTEFIIKNKNNITEFMIVRAGFDDHMQIKINDQVVYIGPHGGNKLELKDQKNFWGNFKVVDTGSNQHGCELNTNWNFGLSIDLKPYLVEGKNRISTRVIVSGAGEGWFQIKAKQNCCTNWDIKREEKCDYS